MLLHRPGAAFHPELKGYARALPRTLVTPLTVPVFRRLPVLRRDPPAVRNVVLNSGLTVRVHQPRYGSNGSALLWIHGGGYMLDDRTGAAADPDAAKRRLWNVASNRRGWASYLGGADPDRAVPARREDLSGLAPAWIGAGTFDVLHEEAVRYSGRLEASGVCTELVTVPGAFHGFDAVAPKTAVARNFVRAQGAWLRNQLVE